jgi:8-oxo-dGTP pyrophosphatase MutT (NUDIX family)
VCRLTLRCTRSATAGFARLRTRVNSNVRQQRVTPSKACPVVLRSANGQTEVLAFEHPLAGFQLVKGTIEPGESVEAAALRELAEESGIQSAVARRSLGTHAPGSPEQVWAFVECVPSEALPSAWIYRTADGGGHSFRFFWHPLFGSTSEHWHTVFRNALRFIQAAA